MKRIAKVAALGLAGLGLVIVSVTPAQAHTTGALAFVGSASVTPGLGYPVLGADGTGNAWNFAITTGFGAGIDADGHATTPSLGLGAPGAGPATGGVSGGTLRSGSIVPGAFCGASGGTGGSGSITIDNLIGPNDTIPLSDVGWRQSVASLIVFSNHDGNFPAPVQGIVSAIPPLPVVGTGSCSAGTAQDFTIVGVAVALAAPSP